MIRKRMFAGFWARKKSLEITTENADEDNLTVFANCAGTVQRFVFTRI